MPRSYRFTAFWARLLASVGVAVLTCFLALAALVGLTAIIPLAGLGLSAAWDTVSFRVLTAVLVALVGLLLAAPLIVTGQVLRILLDQRRLLARIARRDGGDRAVYRAALRGAGQLPARCRVL